MSESLFDTLILWSVTSIQGVELFRQLFLQCMYVVRAYWSYVLKYGQ
jgi:hypothetical protein